MPLFRLDDRLAFPSPELAEESLLAVGGDLRPERLILGYCCGIFPWYEDGQPILWHSPDPRMVLEAGRLRVPRSVRRTRRRGRFEVTLDSAFSDVIAACAVMPRPGQEGTWITGEMRDAYVRLHALGLAHSVEAWLGKELVGGLYGVCLGHAFFGESMFTRVSDASKVAFVTLVEQLRCWDINLIDCQVYTDHLSRFGAEEWPRSRYLAALKKALTGATRRGPWRFDSSQGRSPEATNPDF